MSLPGDDVRSIEDLPLALRVPEAAAALRISPNTVYSLIRQWQATDGREGIPALQLGRSLRIPRVAVARMLGLAEAQPHPPQTTTDLGPGGGRGAA